MICRIDGAAHRGRAVRVDASVSPGTVATAVREGRATEGDTVVAVQARDPHPVHEYVGCLHPDMGLRARTALAAAGRARGLTTPQDDSLARTRDALAAITPDEVDASDERQAVAATEETDSLRERVAAARGRLAARREEDLPTADARERLEAAITDLSEAETGAAAARQDRDRARERVRRVHDDLEERFRLEDELANLRREARAWLVDRLRPAYESALTAVPGRPDATPEDPFAVDPVTAGLAVARVASPDAPVVIACDRFETARDASRWLNAPVIRVE